MNRSLLLSVFLFAMMFAPLQVRAYFNATYLSTTLFLRNSTAVHVVEGVQLFVSNSSTAVYNQDRQAFNLTLSDWQKATGGSPFLGVHIINPKSSISNFTFLPGPLVPSGSGGGFASLTISYDANNATSVSNIAPRKFEYRLNNSIFNYLHSASGQALFPNARLTVTVPNGTQIMTIYPLPDFPQPNSFGKYSGSSFSWFSGEPLQGFGFVYTVSETPQEEVIRYFSSVYRNYKPLIYAVIVIILVGAAVYLYNKMFG